MNAEILGVLELLSIADGYVCLDAMIKSAPVSVLKADIVNPGKFLILVTGDVASTEIALDAGIGAVENSSMILDHLLLTALDGSILPALQTFRAPRAPDALGIVESVSVAGAIEAADRAAKKAEIDIVSIKAGNETGGRGILMINGPVSDVQPAVDAAAEPLFSKGMLYSRVIIPGPHPDLKGFFNGN